MSTAVDSPTMCSGRTGTRVRSRPVAARSAAATAGGVEMFGGLAHALEAVRRLGVGVLEDLDPHGRHVEHGGQQVVGERRVEDLAVARPGSPRAAPGRAPGRCRPRSGPRAPAGSSPARPPGWWRGRRRARGRGRSRRRRRRGGPRRRTAGARRPGRSRRAGRSRGGATRPSPRSTSSPRTSARRSRMASSDSGSGPPSRSAASASVRSRTASHAAFTAPPVTYVWREAELEPAEPTACRRRGPRRARRRAPSGRSGPGPSRRPGRPRRRRCGPRRAARRRRCDSRTRAVE